MKDPVVGIYIADERTFYHLETGPLPKASVVNRLKSLLIRRGKITYHREDPRQQGLGHRIMNLEEAEDMGANIETLYLSRHIEKSTKSKTKEKTTNPWD